MYFSTENSGPSSRWSKVPLRWAYWTSSVVTAVIGAVGPEHCTLVPPKPPVTAEMSEVERMPLSAPPSRSASTPKAAPREMAAKEVVSAASTFGTTCGEAAGRAGQLPLRRRFGRERGGPGAAGR